MNDYSGNPNTSHIYIYIYIIHLLKASVTPVEKEKKSYGEMYVCCK